MHAALSSLQSLSSEELSYLSITLLRRGSCYEFKYNLEAFAHSRFGYLRRGEGEGGQKNGSAEENTFLWKFLAIGSFNFRACETVYRVVTGRLPLIIQ